MPWKVADFVCQSCGHEFEDLYREEDCSDVACPECRVSAVTKRLAAPLVMQVALADGMKRNESMELLVRKQKLKTDSYKVPVSQREGHLQEMSSLTQAAKAAQEKGK